METAAGGTGSPPHDCMKAMALSRLLDADDLDAALEAGRIQRWAELNTRFHLAIATLSGMRTAASAWRSLRLRNDWSGTIDSSAWARANAAIGSAASAPTSS